MDPAFLKKVKLFKDLTQDELKIISALLSIRKFRKGETIITEAEEGDEMYILHEGEVEISRQMSMIDEQEKIDKTFVRLKAANADHFGEVGLLGKQKRTASCKAVTDCQLYCLKHCDFQVISHKYPQISTKILMEIASHLAETLEKTNQDILKLTTALIYALKG
ncbi:MAG TPA: cyclic nucleotide-binding domain-containing protein [Candidatus Cloacimonadota bacterium]|nr:cyclic nucleotide-binding domain-containing protein [Candidatus Cloacimonadota bacterium]